MRFSLSVSFVLVSMMANLGWADPFVQNNSFELPNIGTGSGSYREGNPPTDWTEVVGGGGYVGNGSAYGNSNAPDGTQALLLKSLGGVEQTLSGFTVGDPYTISFYAEARTSFNSTNPFQVLMDGTPLTFNGSTTVTPTAGLDAYTLYKSTVFFADSATPTLEFNGLSPSDNSSFVDLVTFQAVPEPSAIVGLVGLCGMGLVALARRRRKAA